jgi:hypothetical protein
VLLAWGALLVASAELVSAVGRLPNQTDLHYLFDPQFMENSTGGALAHPWLPWLLASALLVLLASSWYSRGQRSHALPRTAWALPVLLLAAHWGSEQLFPSDADSGANTTSPTSCCRPPPATCSIVRGTGRRRNPVTPLPSAGPRPTSTAGCWPAQAAPATCWSSPWKASPAPTSAPTARPSAATSAKT